MNNGILQQLGIKIGHYTDKKNLTGTTVFVAEKGADIGMDIRGSWPGILSLPYFGATSSGKIAQAVVLTGGSAYGLESVFGVMQYLEEHGIGSKTRAGITPSIAAAVLYDLAVGSSKVRPQKKDGLAAAKKATSTNLEQGNVGAGTGATTGKWVKGGKKKGGFGIGVTQLTNGIMAGAFVVTNSVGDIINPLTNNFYMDEGKYDITNTLTPEDFTNLSGLMKSSVQKTNTTLAVIATNVALKKIQLIKVAELAHDGMARAIFPVHTMLDGDIVFALSSHTGERKEYPDMPSISLIDCVGLAAQEAIMKAIKNSMIHATAIDGFSAYK